MFGRVVLLPFPSLSVSLCHRLQDFDTQRSQKSLARGFLVPSAYLSEPVGRLSVKNQDIKYTLQQKNWKYRIGVSLHSPLITNTNAISQVLRYKRRLLVGLSRQAWVPCARRSQGSKVESAFRLTSRRLREHLQSQIGSPVSVRIMESLGIWASVINHPCHGVFFPVIIMSCEALPLATATERCCSLSYSCDNLLGTKVHFT